MLKYHYYALCSMFLIITYSTKTQSTSNDILDTLPGHVILLISDHETCQHAYYWPSQDCVYDQNNEPLHTAFVEMCGVIYHNIITSPHLIEGNSYLYLGHFLNHQKQPIYVYHEHHTDAITDSAQSYAPMAKHT